MKLLSIIKRALTIMVVRDQLTANALDAFANEADIERRLMALLSLLGYRSTARQQVWVKQIDRTTGRMDVVVEVDGLCLLIFELKHTSVVLSSGFDQLRKYSMSITAKQGIPPKFIILYNGKTFIIYKPMNNGDISGTFGDSPDFVRQIDSDEKGAAGKLIRLIGLDGLTSNRLPVEVDKGRKEVAANESAIDNIIAAVVAAGRPDNEIALVEKCLNSQAIEPAIIESDKMSANLMTSRICELAGDDIVDDRGALKWSAVSLRGDDFDSIIPISGAKNPAVSAIRRLYDSIVEDKPIQDPDNAEFYRRILAEVCKKNNQTDKGPANDYRFPNDGLANIGQTLYYLPAKMAKVLQIGGYDLDKCVFRFDNGAEISVAQLVDCATL